MFPKIFKNLGKTQGFEHDQGCDKLSDLMGLHTKTGLIYVWTLFTQTKKRLLRWLTLCSVFVEFCAWVPSPTRLQLRSAFSALELWWKLLAFGWTSSEVSSAAAALKGDKSPPVLCPTSGQSWAHPEHSPHHSLRSLSCPQSTWNIFTFFHMNLTCIQVLGYL